MDQKAKIAELSKELDDLKVKVRNKAAELGRVIDSKEFKIKELIDEYNSTDSFRVGATYRRGTYEKILGGDGRSSPWSITEIGMLLKIAYDLKSMYVSPEDIAKLVAYVEAMEDRKIDAIFVNGTQWSR